MFTSIPLLNGANKNRPSQATQVVVYGLTPEGCIAAIEAKRNGASVLLVGGWRDWNIGGMPCGGLCHQDYVNSSLSTGLAQTFWTNAGGTNFTSWQGTSALQGMLTSAGITPVLTQGVSRAIKNAATRAITSFITQDGQQFSGNYFIDGSYESDLMALSGITYNVGQDAKNSTTDPGDGWGVELNDTIDNFSFGGKFLGISPYVTAGDSTSGLLPGVTPKPYPSVGAQNLGQMAFCFRMNMRKYPVGGSPDQYWVALPNTPPPGYNVQNYELLLRWIAAVSATGATYTVNGGGTWNNSFANSQAIVGGSTGGINNTGVYDWNQGSGPPLIDTVACGAFDPQTGYLLGGASEYVESSYARREQIWQFYQSWVLGWLYLLQYGTDSRIPAAMQEDFLTFGFDSRQFTNPYPGDLKGFPYQLYVRTARRMVSDFVIHINDLQMTDGTTPRSIKTIAQGCYQADCHTCNIVINEYKTPDAVAQNAGAPPGTTTGGANQMYPIPYDIIVPSSSECSNLFCIWGPSASSEAMCSLRIENPMMQMAQAAGCAAAIGCANGYPAVQDISYTALRAQLLSEGMVLPQTN